MVFELNFGLVILRPDGKLDQVMTVTVSLVCDIRRVPKAICNLRVYEVSHHTTNESI